MSTAVEVSALPHPIPRWTIPSFDRTAGRYPLGLEAVALDQLGSLLASGLPVVSRHPRYWSIYTYIIKRFWDSKRSPQTNKALGAFLKPRESVFAFASLLCRRHQIYPNEELPGILGRDTFAPWLYKHPLADLPLNLPYLENSLGGYGQTYRGAMAQLGLVALAESTAQLRVDAPFGDLGAAVADRFSESIAGTTYARRYADEDLDSIPIDVARELAEVGCLCRLADQPGERDLLTEVLMGSAQQPHISHRLRADTVRMYLDLAAATATTPLDQAQFRGLLYFGASTTDTRWQASPAVDPTRRLWAMVQLREYLVRALNSLLIHFVRWGISHRGLLYPQDFGQYAARLQSLVLAGHDLLPATTLEEVLLRDLTAAMDPLVERAGWPLSPTALAEPLNERYLSGRCDGGHADDAPVHALLTLLLIQRRLALAEQQGHIAAPERTLLEDGGTERLATAVVCRWLAHAIEGGNTAGEALVQMVRTMVVRQHLRVAQGKLRTDKDTYRFHELPGGLQFIDQGDDRLRDCARIK